MSEVMTLFRAVFVHIEVGPAAVTMSIKPSGLLNALLQIKVDDPAAEDPLLLTVPMRVIRGIGTKLIVEGPSKPKVEPDPAMVRLIGKAHRLQQTIFQNSEMTMTQLAAEEGMVKSYYTRVARLAWLAPDIVQAILIGAHPPTLNAEVLMKGDALPMDWQEQRTALGFI